MTALSLLILVAAATVAATAASGGGACTREVHCGNPAANMPTQREQTVSLTGSCVNNKCECVQGFGCDRCAYQIEHGTTVRTIGSNLVDMCTLSYGYGVCSADSDCGQGLCIDNHCVCYTDWVCPFCTMQLQQDIYAGATCGQYTSGGAECVANSDCGAPNGVCANGRCQCSAGYVCSRCGKTQREVLDGASCPCDNIDCGANGFCQSGSCVCTVGWSGPKCETNLCADKDCSGHGTCQPTTGVCECQPGYTGDNCDTGGASCRRCEDCGGFPDLANDPSGNTILCAGLCNSNGTCDCYPSYTCDRCQGVGNSCDGYSTGGGTCDGPEHCNNGGLCYQGYCVCYQGFLCHWCTATSKSETCPEVNPALEVGSGGALSTGVNVAILVAALLGTLQLWLQR